IRVVTRSIGVTYHVHPMPAPALAIVRRREQALDEVRPGIRRLVVEKRIQLLRRGRQANEIEMNAARERALGCETDRLESLLTQFGQNESVNWIRGAVQAALRRFDFFHRPKSPVVVWGGAFGVQRDWGGTRCEGKQQRDQTQPGTRHSLHP